MTPEKNGALSQAHGSHDNWAAAAASGRDPWENGAMPSLTSHRPAVMLCSFIIFRYECTIHVRGRLKWFFDVNVCITVKWLRKKKKDNHHEIN